MSNRGLCGLLLNFRLLFVLHSRIPANEGLPELVIEHLRPDLQQVVRAGLSPSHLLLLNHALADHLIHRGLCEGRRNFLSVPVTVPYRIARESAARASGESRESKRGQRKLRAENRVP